MTSKYQEHLKPIVFYTAALMAIVFAIIAVIIPPTEHLPSGLAGASAAIIAFCTVIMAMTKETESKARLKPEIFIALGSLTSAWLAITHSFDLHVLNYGVPLVLTVYVFVCASLVLLFRSVDGR